jgi:hypothetical protein
MATHYYMVVGRNWGRETMKNESTVELAAWRLSWAISSVVSTKIKRPGVRKPARSAACKRNPGRCKRVGASS